MKRQLHIIYGNVIIGMLVCFALCGTVNAQNSVPNGGFETWDSSTFQLPMYYPYTANGQSFFSTFTDTIANVIRVSPGYHGTYAVQLTTTAADGDTTGGFFLNTNPNNGNPGTWTGGTPYTQMPTGIRGYYKSNTMPGDSGLIIVAFSKAGANIGAYVFAIGGTHAAFTLFDFTFAQPLSMAPDSVILGFTSSDLLINNGVAGSTVTIDSVSFKGVSSQPADMNGDFELWQSQTLMKPGSWYYNGDQNGDGMQRTTDAYAGNYAVELTTYFGQQNNQPAASPGQISTGWYPNNCDSNCNELGGYPFSNQTDTLVFYYKYVPSGADSANVSLTFKKNGISIYNDGMSLEASGSYKKAELPIYIGSAPDTVIVDFQSSFSNNGNISISTIGSDLKIDDIYFKSQVNTGIKEFNSNNKLVLYPNPVKTYITLEVDPQTVLQGMELRMYDMFGRTVKTMAVTNHTVTFKKENLTAGMYFYEVLNNAEILKTGKLIVE